MKLKVESLTNITQIRKRTVIHVISVDYMNLLKMLMKQKNGGFVFKNILIHNNII